MAESTSQRRKPIAFLQDICSYLWSRQHNLKYFICAIAVSGYSWRKKKESIAISLKYVDV